ncbi:MAG TPA: hypothetical protein VG267_07195 [Terracidiphilus sp.]|jgi:hypothetical protein|nr:hypothetical protein [Terracidiphilus sp.]
MVGMRQLFGTPPVGQSAGQIIRWWEARRFHYNVVVLAAILLAWGIDLWPFTQMQSWPKVVAYFVGMSVLLIQIPANIWYTGGWVVDLILKRGLHRQWTGFAPWALGVGMVFSLVFVAVIILVVSRVAGVNV